jgi:hypothetical protein
MNGSGEDSSKSSCQGNLGHPYQLAKKKIVSAARNISVDSDTNKRNAGFVPELCYVPVLLLVFWPEEWRRSQHCFAELLLWTPFSCTFENVIENTKLLQEKSILGIWCCCLLTVL